jgi:hypothetical protein
MGKCAAGTIVVLLLGLLGVRRLQDEQLRGKLDDARFALWVVATAASSHHGDIGGFPASRPFRELSGGGRDLAAADGENLAAIETGSRQVGGNRVIVPGGIKAPIDRATFLKPDPFSPEMLDPDSEYLTIANTGLLFRRALTLPPAYYAKNQGIIVFSPGPDYVYDIDPIRDFDAATTQQMQQMLALTYDPTNGLRSRGDIWVSRQWPSGSQMGRSFECIEYNSPLPARK